jgi:hypothetical protein
MFRTSGHRDSREFSFAMGNLLGRHFSWGVLKFPSRFQRLERRIMTYFGAIEVFGSAHFLTLHDLFGFVFKFQAS